MELLKRDCNLPVNEMDAAVTVANEFNRTHSTVRLKPVPVTKHLTVGEIAHYAKTYGAGWMLPAHVFAAIRGRKATHGEAIATGRLLRIMNLDRMRKGPSTLYLLDNSHFVDAD